MSKKLGPVELLECVIEGIVPFINAHADIDIPEVERHHGKEKSPGGPFLFRYPVGFREPPGVTHRILF